MVGVCVRARLDVVMVLLVCHWLWLLKQQNVFVCQPKKSKADPRSALWPSVRVPSGQWVTVSMLGYGPQEQVACWRNTLPPTHTSTQHLHGAQTLNQTELKIAAVVHLVLYDILYTFRQFSQQKLNNQWNIGLLEPAILCRHFTFSKTHWTCQV